jgi:hypothetical protein
MRQADDFPVKEGEDYEGVLYDLYYKDLAVMLEKLNALDPQLEINGFRNVWIAKPNCTHALRQSSRAEGA